MKTNMISNLPEVRQSMALVVSISVKDLGFLFLNLSSSDFFLPLYLSYSVP